MSAFGAYARAAATSSGDNEWPQLWILKPQQSFNQIGISMVFAEEADVADDAAAARWLREVVPTDGSWTLQEYVMHF